MVFISPVLGMEKYAEIGILYRKNGMPKYQFLIAISFFIFGAWGPHAIAQENKLLFQNLAVDITLESKAKTIANEAFSISANNPDSALRLSKKAMGIALEAKSAYAYSLAMGYVGWAYFKKGEKDSALWYITSARLMFHDLHKTDAEAHTEMNLSMVYENISDYPSALQHIGAAMKLADVGKDSLTLIISEKMIGIIYRRLGYFDKAKLYLERSANAAHIYKNPKYYADAVSSLASLYLQIDSLDSARILYRRALDVYKNANDISGVAMINEDLGLLYMAIGNNKSLDSSLYYYRQAYTMNMKLNNKYDVAYEKISISDVLIRQKKYKIAEKYLLESIPVFDTLHDIYNEYISYKALSIAYDSMHDYRKSYNAILQAQSYYDTLNKQEKNQAIADMLVKYEANRKDTTIALLNARNELAERRLSKNHLVELFSFALIALMVLLGLVLMNRNKIKQRFGQLQMRNQIASDLHDEVGSSLSSILMLGKIALTEKNSSEDIINKINTNASEMIERIGDIVWATNPKYDDGKNLNEKICNYILQANQLGKLKVNLEISEEVAKIKFKMDVRRNVFLILKEAINNILKHSNATVTDIHIYCRQKQLHAEVTDNGSGFDLAHHNDGNGLDNMIARAESIGGKCNIVSKPGKGTTINITVPL